MSELSKRELWLMRKAFEAGEVCYNFDDWLDEHVINEADVKMVLEAEAPKALNHKEG